MSLFVKRAGVLLYVDMISAVGKISVDLHKVDLALRSSDVVNIRFPEGIMVADVMARLFDEVSLFSYVGRAVLCV